MTNLQLIFVFINLTSIESRVSKTKTEGYEFIITCSKKSAENDLNEVIKRLKNEMNSDVLFLARNNTQDEGIMVIEIF